MDIDTRIAHSERKLDRIRKSSKETESDAKKQKGKVDGLKAELASVRKAADDAQGVYQNIR